MNDTIEPPLAAEVQALAGRDEISSADLLPLLEAAPATWTGMTG